MECRSCGRDCEAYAYFCSSCGARTGLGAEKTGPGFNLVWVGVAMTGLFIFAAITGVSRTVFP
jgi:hypothetical protein